MATIKIGRWLYAPIRADDVPSNVRFDVPRHRQGQIVEYSFGDTGRYENGEGDPYACRVDRSDGSGPEYFRLVGPAD